MTTNNNESGNESSGILYLKVTSKMTSLYLSLSQRRGPFAHMRFQSLLLSHPFNTRAFIDYRFALRKRAGAEADSSLESVPLVELAPKLEFAQKFN